MQFTAYIAAWPFDGTILKKKKFIWLKFTIQNVEALSKYKQWYIFCLLLGNFAELSTFAS